MILFKNWAKQKVKSYIYYVNQFLRGKRHKNKTRNVSKNSLFCLIFVIFFIFSPVFKPDFYIFSYNEQLRKI